MVPIFLFSFCQDDMYIGEREVLGNPLSVCVIRDCIIVVSFFFYKLGCPIVWDIGA